MRGRRDGARQGGLCGENLGKGGEEKGRTEGRGGVKNFVLVVLSDDSYVGGGS